MEPLSVYQEELLDFLQNNRAFHSIDMEDLTQYLAICSEQHFPPDAYIAREGDIAEFFYVIKSGKVVVVKENFVKNTSSKLAYLYPGECIGEVSLIENSPHSVCSASLKADTETELLVFSIEELAERIDRNIYNTMIVNLAQLLCQRLRASNERGK